MSWEQLLAAQHEAAEWQAARAAERPVACPHCHTALEDGPGGVLFCPFLPHYEYPRDGRTEL